MDPAEVTRSILMYFILPLWLAAGFADYLCHRAAHIERTSGVKESALHILQFAEMGVAILAAMFLEINALVILIMIACFFLHEATALWDLSYASATREVGPIEQHVHSFLEMLPLMGLLMIIVLYWPQFLSLLGLEPASFDIRLKEPPYRSLMLRPSWHWSSCSKFCPTSRSYGEQRAAADKLAPGVISTGRRRTKPPRCPRLRYWPGQGNEVPRNGVLVQAHNLRRLRRRI